MCSDNLVSLVDETTSIKVSSTLEKATGKKKLIDGSTETCWTSQQGLPQFIQLSFRDNVIPKRLAITFQGGFVGTRCTVRIPEKKDWEVIATVYPEDVNRRQVFDLPQNHPKITGGISSVKLIFEESSDFFGRITVYDLKVEGLKGPRIECNSSIGEANAQG